ncbi:uncharacterized protein METZ01_LOCUS430434, partial [marine metagenome]
HWLLWLLMHLTLPSLWSKCPLRLVAACSLVKCITILSCSVLPRVTHCGRQRLNSFIHVVWIMSTGTY